MSTSKRFADTVISLHDIYPQQVGMTRSEIVAANFFEKRMLKHKPRSLFENYILLLFAALLESSQTVIEYVPRPFKLRIGNQYFIPSFFVRSVGASEIIHVQKTPLPKNRHELITQYFSELGYSFRCISPDEITQKKIEAENWLKIVQCLYLYKDVDANAYMPEILERIDSEKQTTLEQVIFRKGSDEEQFCLIAIYKMAYTGQIQLDLRSNPLSYSTLVFMKK